MSKGHNMQKERHACGVSFFLAAGEGFEPSQTESESVVLPLHNPALFISLVEDECYYSKYSEFVKGYFYFL